MSRHGSGFGGDERNPNSRRYKAWNNPHKASNDGLADRRVYPESSNRPRYSESNIKQTQAGKTIQKSKLRSPVKTGLGQSTIRINRSHTAATAATAAKTTGMTKVKSDMTKVKPDSDSSERKQKLLNEKKEATEQVENNVEVNNKEESSVQHENGNGTELHGNEATVKETINKREISENEKSENGNAENGNTENGKSENGDTPQILERDEEEFALQLEAEENNTKAAGDSQTNLLDSNKNEEQSEPQSQSTKDDSQTESESCSVEIVESTTSEVTEVTESNTPSGVQDKDQQPTSEEVSYDTNLITLKDVKIKLNDCLKESKGEDENNVDQSLPTYAHKEDTFGKTLRTISGRKSIGRHITLRDRQPSPNSSLFVNTSNMSVAEEGSSDYKILRHRATLSELSANGGTPFDRKRKLARDSPSTLKKAKTEESSLLNYSLDILKYPFSPRRPVQVSTPYKFEAEKRISTSEEVVTEEPSTAKKWCVIM